MAYAINAAGYSTTLLNDTLTGSPDYWTNLNSATHSYASSELTVADNSGAASRGIYADQGAQTARKIYVRTTWKRTASNSSTPLVLTLCDTSNTISVGIYQDHSTNTIYARNGAGWTSTGVTLASGVTQQLEYVIDRDAGTWKLYFDGSLIGTYNIDATTDAAFGRLLVGGGTTAATWTFVFSDVILWKHTIATGPSGVKTRNGVAIGSVKTLSGVAIGSVNKVNGVT